MNKLSMINNESITLCSAIKLVRLSVEEKKNISPKLQYIITNLDYKDNHNREDIRIELEKILFSDNVREIFLKLNDLNILKVFSPHFYRCFDFNQHNKYHDKDVFEHIVSVIKNVPKKKDLRLAAFLHDIGKPFCFTLDENKVGHFRGHEVVSSIIANKILSSLGYEKEFIQNVVSLIRYHMIKFKYLNQDDIKNLVNNLGEEFFKDLLLLKIADNLSKNPKYIEIDNLLYIYESI